jgi:tetratricopeptide (TPR) repeat protein
LSKLLGTAHEDIDYHNRDRTSQFYAQSWFFVHWAMFGQGSPGAGSLSHYLAGMKTSRTAEAAFTAAFGGDYKMIDHRLAEDLESGEYNSPSYALPADLPAIEPPRTATEGEVEYALGAVQLGGRGAAEALPHLLHAVELDPQNLSAWEALGFAQLMQDNKDAALAALDRAAGLGSRNALVWQNRAWLQYNAALPAGGFGGTSNSELFNSTARDYRRAIELDPRCRSAYDGLAAVVDRTEPAVGEDLVQLEQGYKFFPEDDLLAVGVATARLRVGDRAAATKELRAVFEGEHSTALARQAAARALENEVLGRFNARFESAQRQRDYAEAIAAIDEAVSENVLSEQNRRSLAATRREIAQIRRLAEAAALANEGRLADAVATIQSVLDDSPATASVRHDAERLMKQCSGK